MYHGLKDRLLTAGAEGRMPIDHMVDRLEVYSLIRRMVEQGVKASVHWAGLRDTAGTAPGWSFPKMGDPQSLRAGLHFPLQGYMFSGDRAKTWQSRPAE